MSMGGLSWCDGEGESEGWISGPRKAGVRLGWPTRKWRRTRLGRRGRRISLLARVDCMQSARSMLQSQLDLGRSPQPHHSTARPLSVCTRITLLSLLLTISHGKDDGDSDYGWWCGNGLRAHVQEALWRSTYGVCTVGARASFDFGTTARRGCSLWLDELECGACGSSG